jgi:hypothetical protein
MSSINLPSPLSSSISCGVCGQNISTCNCSKATLTKAYYSSSSGSGIQNTSYQIGGMSGYMQALCGTCGNPLYSCQCSYQPSIYKPLQLFTCNACGKNLNLCICPPANIFVTPNVTPPYITTTTGTFISPTDFILSLEIVDVETKAAFKHEGYFTIKNKSDKEGLYGFVNGLYLPKEFKDCFACVRKEVPKVWQIRTPLVFQLNALVEGQDPEYHFMTLTSFDDADQKDEGISLYNPHLQEVMNTLEFIRLVELQRVFTKLLRRI